MGWELGVPKLSVTPSTQEAQQTRGMERGTQGPRVAGPAGQTHPNVMESGGTPAEAHRSRAQWAVPLPCAAGRPELALWEPARPPGVLAPEAALLSPMRGSAPGGRLSWAPEDMAGGPPSSGEGLHLAGHLGGTPGLSRWRPASAGGASAAPLLGGAGGDPDPWRRPAALRGGQALCKVIAGTAADNPPEADTEKGTRAQRS